MSSPSRPGALALLDEAAETVGRLPAAVGLLWLTAMPARLVLVRFFLDLIALGKGAADYGDYLGQLAALYLGAWLFSLWGRRVFVRRCRRGTARVALRDLAGTVYLAALFEFLFWSLLPAFVLAPFVLIFAGLAAAQPESARPGLLVRLRGLAASAGSAWTLCKLALLFLLGFLFALINLHTLAQLLYWTAAAVPAVERSGFSAVLTLGHPLYLGLLLAGATLLVEPFWLAALLAQVDRQRALGSGEDLRARFQSLRDELRRAS